MKKLLLLLLSLLSLLFVCCDKKQENNSDILCAGFGGEEEESPVWLGFTSEKSVIKKDEDLTIILYFGTLLKYPDDYLILFKKDEVLPDDIYTELVISYGLYTKELLQKGEYTFTNPEYTLRYTKIDEINYKIIENFGADLYPMLGKNSQCEQINLSSSLFSEENGYICFIINSYGVYSDVIDKDRVSGGSVTLYYRIDKDNIILYDSYYKYFNSIIK